MTDNDKELVDEVEDTIREFYDPWSDKPYQIAQALLLAFDVRFRGRVTEAEVEIAFQVLRQYNAAGPDAARAALEAAAKVRS